MSKVKTSKPQINATWDVLGAVSNGATVAIYTESNKKLYIALINLLNHPGSLKTSCNICWERSAKQYGYVLYSGYLWKQHVQLLHRTFKDDI